MARPVPLMDSAAKLPNLKVLRLSLTGFRNHPRLDVDLTNAPVVITGPNGLGKTNILEALSLLTPGRGLRGAAYSEMAAQGGDGAFSIFAQVSGAQGAVGIGTGVMADTPERRIVRIDGQVQAAGSALGRHMRALWLTPAMDRLFADPASARRRFVDRLALAIDPDHADHGAQYERAMRQRNKLLREARIQGRGFDPDWAQVLERQMAEAGIALAAGRRTMLGWLEHHVAHAPDGPFPKPIMALNGMIETSLDTMPAVEVEDLFAQTLARGRLRDQEAGRTLDGPHTSDFAVRHGLKDQPAELCSTGEQKALLIAMILAQARGMAAEGLGPILLLDEVAAHLDADRRAALFDAICDLGLQAWMTGTDAMLFDALGPRAQNLNLVPCNV